ncbi:MAG: sugar ABC transporter permease [Clostridia bacterium]|nr:sugar ABC transporter permease [Clostridia bacterium]
MKKKTGGLEAKRRKYGFYFTLPWLIGIVIFFLTPLTQSIIYSFSKVKLTVTGLESNFSGFKNFSTLLLKDALFTENFKNGFLSFLYSFPLIMILSLILGILLNQKFKGRMFFRAVYFLPVIIASGVIIEMIFMTRTGDIASTGTDESVRDGMISVSSIIGWFGLPTNISDYINSVVSKIMDLVWNCGIQIVLWIAGLQAIPDSLYEVSKVEGATKWEEFWFITFPMLSRITILVAIFTAVEQITAKTDPVIKQSIVFSQAQKYGEASAMLWMYFIAVGLFVGLLLMIFVRICAKKWE